jgi:hypothetical protein
MHLASLIAAEPASLLYIVIGAIGLPSGRSHKRKLNLHHPRAVNPFSRDEFRYFPRSKIVDSASTLGYP